jgi:hypothetical protein
VRHALITGAFFAALIGLWKAGTVFGCWSPVLLPPPEAVAEYLWGALKDGSLAEASLVTLERLLLGYAIGVMIGLPLGLTTSMSDIFQGTLGALLGLQTLPSVCRAAPNPFAGRQGNHPTPTGRGILQPGPPTRYGCHPPGGPPRHGKGALRGRGSISTVIPRSYIVLN